MAKRRSLSLNGEGAVASLPSAPARALKGNIVFRRTALGRSKRRLRLLAPTTWTRPSQHLHIFGDDVGGVVFDAVLFVGPVLNPALDYYLFALGQVLAADLRQFGPGHDAVPLGLFLPLPILTCEFPAGGQGEFGYRSAAGGITHLRIGPQIPHQNNLVEPSHFSSCHRRVRFLNPLSQKRRPGKVLCGNLDNGRGGSFQDSCPWALSPPINDEKFVGGRPRPPGRPHRLESLCHHKNFSQQLLMGMAYP